MLRDQVARLLSFLAYVGPIGRCFRVRKAASFDAGGGRRTSPVAIPGKHSVRWARAGSDRRAAGRPALVLATTTNQLNMECLSSTHTLFDADRTANK